MVPMTISNLPEKDHIMRYVPWSKLRRDGNDTVLGFLPQAFQLREGEEALSVNWVEYFPNPATRVHDCVRALRQARSAGKKSAFGVGNVETIKQTCLDRGIKVRILHEPKEGEPAHAGIRRLPRDDLTLLAALAEDAFIYLIRNADVPETPT